MQENSLFNSCLAKQAHLKSLFSHCKEAEQIYTKIIELGRTLPPYPADKKTPDHLVKGCQSQLYLHTELKEGKLIFYVEADALISAGLASLLLAIYNQEPPEAILSCPPSFLGELQLLKHLSPGRANGLASLFTKMKAHALSLYSSHKMPQ